MGDKNRERRINYTEEVLLPEVQSLHQGRVHPPNGGKRPKDKQPPSQSRRIGDRGKAEKKENHILVPTRARKKNELRHTSPQTSMSVGTLPGKEEKGKGETGRKMKGKSRRQERIRLEK